MTFFWLAGNDVDRNVEDLRDLEDRVDVAADGGCHMVGRACF